MSALTAIEWQKRSVLRVGAGRRMVDIDEETRQRGFELRMHPSTKRMASIGGFAAGGSGGVGSVTYGGLRELGNIMGARVISIEEKSARHRVEGRRGAQDLSRVGHDGYRNRPRNAFGAGVRLDRFRGRFRRLPRSLKFGHELALADGVVKKLVTPLVWPIPSYFEFDGADFPEGLRRGDRHDRRSFGRAVPVAGARPWRASHLPDADGRVAGAPGLFTNTAGTIRRFTRSGSIRISPTFKRSIPRSVS